MTGGQMIMKVTPVDATFRPPPRRFEAGTPPTAAAVGLGAAVEWMQSLDWQAAQDHEQRLTRRLLDGLAGISRVRVLGPLDTKDRRGVVTFSVEGVSAGDVCRHLDGWGVALRGGHHCAQPLLRAFGVEGAARASLSPYTVDADITALLDGIDELTSTKASRAHRRNVVPATK
jgi:cysteine desulfurase / selenocysteine lyase